VGFGIIPFRRRTQQTSKFFIVANTMCKLSLLRVVRLRGVEVAIGLVYGVWVYSRGVSGGYRVTCKMGQGWQGGCGRVAYVHSKVE
jgi:hypothetical protein